MSEIARSWPSAFASRGASVAAGALLAGLLGCFVVYAVRASVAGALYRGVKYGRYGRTAPPAEQMARCALAHRLYPRSYWLCQWAASVAYGQSLTGDPSQRDGWLKRSGDWSRRGLDLNPYKAGLRLARARVLAAGSPAAGARYWQAYVEWDFWDPANHAVLAGMYAEAGWFDKAWAEVDLIAKFPEADVARREIQRAWKAQQEPPAFGP